MPKLTGFNRKNIGRRNHSALFESPPSTLDEYGHVSYSSGPWQTVVALWWCELVDAEGGEIVQGSMTKSTTEKIASGDAFVIKGKINTKCRCTIDGVVYGITAIRDVAGDNRTIRVELRSLG